MTMATITKSADAPGDLERVLIGNTEFAGDSLETSDSRVVATAQAHPFLDVKLDEVEAPNRESNYDANDPHDNPSADHLSTAASEAAVRAADDNEANVREVAGGEVTAPDRAPVAQAVADTLRNVGVEEEAELPESDDTTGPAPEPARPAPSPDLTVRPTTEENNE